MALTATIYNFDFDLADTDRGVYETLALRVARHPSESEEYMLTRVLAMEQNDAAFRAVSLRPGVIDTDMQTLARGQSEDVLPSVAMFRKFHADRRLVAPDVAAAKIVDKVILGKLRHGATYAWPELEKPVLEN